MLDENVRRNKRRHGGNREKNETNTFIFYAQSLAAFVKTFGTHGPSRLAFGRKSASFFSKLMSKILEDFEAFANPNSDDIVVFSETFKAHLHTIL
ncbi:hypothetical protein TNCT_358451 [Trichonephila clavata]|uniref:Uncharacterized protein n=1 Tax=Trichonephila clavata TaxID=2740835 RepID=A0A8X6I7N7_TRICU|nr:hypothetical protein TNCT_358451 [Trichonephila clavata]